MLTRLTQYGQLHLTAEGERYDWERLRFRGRSPLGVDLYELPSARSGPPVLAAAERFPAYYSRAPPTALRRHAALASRIDAAAVITLPRFLAAGATPESANSASLYWEFPRDGHAMARPIMREQIDDEADMSLADIGIPDGRPLFDAGQAAGELHSRYALYHESGFDMQHTMLLRPGRILSSSNWRVVPRSYRDLPERELGGFFIRFFAPALPRSQGHDPAPGGWLGYDNVLHCATLWCDGYTMAVRRAYGVSRSSPLLEKARKSGELLEAAIRYWCLRLDL